MSPARAKQSSPDDQPLGWPGRLVERALILGIGGGGDAVAATAVAAHVELANVGWVIGGVAWERFVVDPYPGPRPIEQITGGERLGRALLVNPGEGATTPEGVHFCESRLASSLSSVTVLIDVTHGAAEAAAGIDAAAAATGCDLVVLLDVGGDAIASGSEPGLASPLCDAVMIAAGNAASTPCVLGVIGAGCDGELEPAAVLERVATLASAGAWIDTIGVSPSGVTAIEHAAAVAVTEASLLVARAARGEHGPVEIRGGRRTVALSPVAALCFLFDLELAMADLPLAREVADAPTIEAARDALNALGVSTELDYEERRAGS